MTQPPTPVGEATSDHTVYGLGLRSDYALRCALTTTLLSPDVSIRFDSLPPLPAKAPDRRLLHADPRRDARGISPLEVSSIGEQTLFEYADGTRFLINGNGDTVTCETAAEESRENTAVYLLGQVMAFVLRQRGVVSLHGSAAVVDGRAVAFLGDPGAGKSTFATGLAHTGHPLLSDDLLPLLPADTEMLVAPGYAGTKLWPDAVAHLGADTATRILPYSSYWVRWDKRFLDLRADGLQREPRPLGAVFLLEERTHGDEPAVERLGGHAALTALMTHVSLGYLPGGKVRGRELRVLSDVASTVPVWSLRPLDGLETLSRDLEVVLAHVRSGN